MAILRALIEGPGDPEYTNWISLDFDPGNESDLEFFYELQKRAIDQGHSVTLKKEE